MHIYIKNFIFLLLVSFLVAGCQTNNQKNTDSKNAFALNTNFTPNQFKDYWYQGKAEITSYHLEQARYGEIHKGSAVLVFVTEDFSKQKQVKLDNPSSTPKDAVSVLKLNHTRNFNTGIYPYSMMTSVFTPVNQKKQPNTLKVTTSSQEWCGHTFMQLNLNKNNYDVQLNSYFESEGDKKQKLEKAVLEDELFSLIRINPDYLPTGNFNIIPTTIYTRLKHTPFKVETATGELKEDNGKMTYQLNYDELDRKMQVVFEKEFPHEIISWEETYKSGFGSNAKTLTTKALRNKSILLDYWSKHDVEDLHYREKLGLTY